MESYTPAAPFADREATVLVVACSSNSLFPHLRQFLEKGLGLAEGSFDMLLVPGGPQFLLLTEYLPKFAWVGQKWINFLVERHGLSRIVVVSHEDCSWYKEERLLPAFLMRFGHEAGSLKERQKADLLDVAGSLRRSLPSIRVEAYYAEKGADGFLRFQPQA